VDDDWLDELVRAVPVVRSRSSVVGVAGGVAAGKSTVAAALAGTLREQGRSVEVLGTDAFLFPNDELDRRGLVLRKGFPDSYDAPAMEQALRDLRAGVAVAVPVYSHVTYDRVPGEVRTVSPTDVVLIEGVNALQPPVVGLVDLAVYVDAAEDDLRTWFDERFLRFCAAGDGFYAALTEMTRAEQLAVARSAWDQVNGVNLHEHILPSRDRAAVVIAKARDHSAVLRRPRARRPGAGCEP
jgi:type I pantothenate kinase